MNCQPGDLAIKIKDKPWHEVKVGSIVKVVEFVEGVYEVAGQLKSFAGWHIEFRGSLYCAKGYRYVAEDHELKPIPKDALSEDIFTTEPLPGEATPEGVAA